MTSVIVGRVYDFDLVSESSVSLLHLGEAVCMRPVKAS